MRSSLRQLICVVVLCGTALAAVSIALSSRAEPATFIARQSYFAYPDYPRVLNYMAALEADKIHDALEEIVAYVSAVEAARLAEEARQAEIARSRQPGSAPTKGAAGSTPAGGSGCCTHSDAWWHGVAICEQGGRNDPYFGYFSFMDGSAGGKSWDEQVAMGNALLNRVGHEVGPWAAACVAAGYAASPSG